MATGRTWVALALRAGDADGARSALAAMDAGWPDDGETAAAWALVGHALGWESLPERGGRTAEEASATALAGLGTPDGFRLEPVYPNPFNPQARVVFETAEPGRVRVAAYDALGRTVAVLADGRYEAGVHALMLDGTRLASGLYLVRAAFTPENGSAVRALTQPVTLLK